jgi:hypothetical protein
MVPHVAILINWGDDRLTNERLWLWVPAFAGTTLLSAGHRRIR